MGSRQELFSVPLDGSQMPVMVSDVVLDQREVRVPFAVGANGRHVAYLADRGAVELFELFHAPLSASRPPVKVNPPLVIGRVEGNLEESRFSRDGAYAVYLATSKRTRSSGSSAFPSARTPCPCD